MQCLHLVHWHSSSCFPPSGHNLCANCSLGSPPWLLQLGQQICCGCLSGGECWNTCLHSPMNTNTHMQAYTPTSWYWRTTLISCKSQLTSPHFIHACTHTQHTCMRAHAHSHRHPPTHTPMITHYNCIATPSTLIQTFLSPGEGA